MFDKRSRVFVRIIKVERKAWKF